MKRWNRGGVLIDAVEGLVGVLAHDAAVAGAGRVDEDEIGGVDEGIFVGDDLVGAAGGMTEGREERRARGRSWSCGDTWWRSRDRRVDEDDGSGSCVLILGKVGGVKHGGRGRLFTGLGGIDAGVGEGRAIERDRGVPADRWRRRG